MGRGGSEDGDVQVREAKAEHRAEARPWGLAAGRPRTGAVGAKVRLQARDGGWAGAARDVCLGGKAGGGSAALPRDRGGCPWGRGKLWKEVNQVSRGWKAGPSAALSRKAGPFPPADGPVRGASLCPAHTGESPASPFLFLPGDCGHSPLCVLRTDPIWQRRAGEGRCEVRKWVLGPLLELRQTRTPEGRVRSGTADGQVPCQGFA